MWAVTNFVLFVCFTAKSPHYPVIPGKAVTWVWDLEWWGRHTVSPPEWEPRSEWQPLSCKGHVFLSHSLNLSVHELWRCQEVGRRKRKSWMSSSNSNFSFHKGFQEFKNKQANNPSSVSLKAQKRVFSGNESSSRWQLLGQVFLLGIKTLLLSALVYLELNCCRLDEHLFLAKGREVRPSSLDYGVIEGPASCSSTSVWWIY